MKELVNKYKPIFLTAILASIIPVAVQIAYVGGALKQLEVNTQIIKHHVEVVTPEQNTQREINTKDITAMKEKLVSQKELLDDLKIQNTQILLVLSKIRKEM